MVGLLNLFCEGGRSGVECVGDLLSPFCFSTDLLPGEDILKRQRIQNLQPNIKVLPVPINRVDEMGLQICI